MVNFLAKGDPGRGEEPDQTRQKCWISAQTYVAESHQMKISWSLETNWRWLHSTSPAWEQPAHSAVPVTGTLRFCVGVGER